MRKVQACGGLSSWVVGARGWTRPQCVSVGSGGCGTLGWGWSLSLLVVRRPSAWLRAGGWGTRVPLSLGFLKCLFLPGARLF